MSLTRTRSLRQAEVGPKVDHKLISASKSQAAVNKHDGDKDGSTLSLSSTASSQLAHTTTRKEPEAMKKSLLPQRTPSKRAAQDVVAAGKAHTSTLQNKSRTFGHTIISSNHSASVTDRKEPDKFDGSQRIDSRTNKQKIGSSSESSERASDSKSRPEATTGPLGKNDAPVKASTGLARSSSIRRPATSTTSTSGSMKPPGHTRNRSTESSTLIKPRSNTVSSRTDITRRRSPEQLGSGSFSASLSRSATPQSLEPGGSAQLKPGSRSSGLSGPDPTERTIKGHSRTRSQPSNIQKDGLLARSKSTLVRPSQAGGATTRSSRPPFTTLQQHYSPKKITRTPTNSALGQPREVAGFERPLKLESLRTQVELLQLHLLHRNAEENIKQWEQSAERQLEQKFRDAVSSYNELVLVQQKVQQQNDATALKNWLADSHFVTGELIQLLARLLQDISQVSDPDGKFTRQARRFDQWLNRVEEVWRERKHQSVEIKSPRFVEGLGDGWRNEGSSLSRRLTVWTGELQNFGDMTDGSSLAAAVDACRSLVRDMLSELKDMQRLEQDVMQREQEWVRQMTDQARALVSNDEEVREHCPLWERD